MSKFLFFFFSLFSTIFLYDADSVYFSDKVYITSLLIQYFSLYYIFSNDKRPYSLNKIFYLFCFFFFGVAPLIQSTDNISLWGGGYFNENDYFVMNILILVILISYQLFYTKFSNFKINIKSLRILNEYKLQELSFIQNMSLILLSITSFSIVFYTMNFNIYNLLLRGGELKSSGLVMTSSTVLVIGNFIRPVPMIAFFFYLISKNKNTVVLFVLSVIAIITVFPLGVPRFYAAALYIPLLLIISSIMKRKNTFSVSFIGGLLILFPFLDQFRNYGKYSNMKIGFNFEMFRQGHFDSYYNFALIVTENIITWGRQLLGVFLFWVPRSFWPNKPVGSGHYIAEELGLTFSNISANYFAEGYINFGFLGIFIFIIFLAWFTAHMDNVYWKVIHTEKNNFFRVIYYIMLGMLFFIMRGDLLSSFAFTIGIILSVLFTFKLANKNENPSSNKLRR